VVLGARDLSGDPKAERPARQVVEQLDHAPRLTETGIDPVCRPGTIVDSQCVAE
jgi:hypothetical protein